MIRVCIVCEGQTEVEFVKSSLTPHLLNHGVNAYPAIVQAPSGRHRGGRVTVERLARFLSHQYREARDLRLTTLVDFYGFQDADGRTCNELEQAILDGVRKCTTGFDPRFVHSYVQMHEFEALLFSDVEQFREVLDGWSTDVRQALLDIRKRFDTLEDINDNRDTAPSKRILKTFAPGTYSKTQHGPVVAEAIGLAAIRQQCPRFDTWIRRLETWGTL